jgi:hypothetical protein
MAIGEAMAAAEARTMAEAQVANAHSQVAKLKLDLQSVSSQRQDHWDASQAVATQLRQAQVPANSQSHLSIHVLICQFTCSSVNSPARLSIDIAVSWRKTWSPRAFSGPLLYS